MSAFSVDGCMSSSHFEEVGSSFLIIIVGSKGEARSVVLLRNFDGESFPDLNASIKFPRLLLLELPDELIFYFQMCKNSTVILREQCHQDC